MISNPHKITDLKEFKPLQKKVRTAGIIHGWTGQTVKSVIAQGAKCDWEGVKGLV